MPQKFSELAHLVPCFGGFAPKSKLLGGGQKVPLSQHWAGASPLPAPLLGAPGFEALLFSPLQLDMMSFLQSEGVSLQEVLQKVFLLHLGVNEYNSIGDIVWHLFRF